MVPGFPGTMKSFGKLPASRIFLKDSLLYIDFFLKTRKI